MIDLRGEVHLSGVKVSESPTNSFIHLSFSTKSFNLFSVITWPTWPTFKSVAPKLFHIISYSVNVGSKLIEPFPICQKDNVQRTILTRWWFSARYGADGAHLRWLEGVIRWEVDVQKEHATGVRTFRRPHDGRLKISSRSQEKNTNEQPGMVVVVVAVVAGHGTSWKFREYDDWLVVSYYSIYIYISIYYGK